MSRDLMFYQKIKIVNSMFVNIKTKTTTIKGCPIINSLIVDINLYIYDKIIALNRICQK